MANVQDRLSDLSWLGDDYKDQGWFPVTDEGEDNSALSADVIKKLIDKKIEESNFAVAIDSGLNVEETSLWLEYRRQLKNIPHQASFPNSIVWPVKP